jgi:cytochrome d ubiquinol oxidase subunit I
MRRGREVVDDLRALKEAKRANDLTTYETLKAKFYDPVYKEEYFRYFGYGYLNNEASLIPNVPLSFYSFHVMVILGFYFFLFFALVLIMLYRDKIAARRWFLWIALFSIPLPYLAGQAGWVVAEAGRQPWVIQDLMVTAAAVSHIDASAVQVTFWLFAIVFTALAIAEIGIMRRQILIGPKKEGGK